MSCIKIGFNRLNLFLRESERGERERERREREEREERERERREREEREILDKRFCPNIVVLFKSKHR